ncbi:MAG: hypothetical protein ABSD51_10625 [Candidatus Binatus sp.]
MLAKEKRRSGWSLAVGAVVAGLIAGYFHFEAFNANRRLHILVAECEKIVKPNSEAPAIPEGFVEDAPTASATDPNASEGLTDDEARAKGYDLSKAIPPVEDPLKLAPVDDSYHIFPGVKSVEGKPPLPAGYVVESCDPENLVGYEKLPLFQARLLNTAEEADNDRADGRSSALIAFLVFCLPLVWYLVLDRIRELSAAIAGKDRNP